MLLFQPQQLLQRSGALEMAIWLPLELIEASKSPIYKNAFSRDDLRYISICWPASPAKQQLVDNRAPAK